MLAVDHFCEGAIAVGANMLRELTGIMPDAVLLARRAPGDLEPYRRHFGVIPQFQAEQNAIIFDARLLSTPVRGADGAKRKELERTVNSYWAVKEPTMSERVSRSLQARIFFERPTIENIAADLQMHSRTLNRRLKAEGSTFRDLLSEARFEIACQLLSVTDIQIAAIGHTLGYADPSGFTRAFERRAGVPPSQFVKSARAN